MITGDDFFLPMQALEYFMSFGQWVWMAMWKHKILLRRSYSIAGPWSIENLLFNAGYQQFCWKRVIR